MMYVYATFYLILCLGLGVVVAILKCGYHPPFFVAVVDTGE